MKRITTLLCLFFISTILFSQNFAGGDGTSANPWQISTPEQLNEVRDYLEDTNADKHFILINDIDLTDYLAEGGNGYAQWDTSGWLPIGDAMSPFCGNFDGNDHSITGLYIYRVSGNRVGLFGTFDYGTIRSVNLQNVDIFADENVGGIAGYILGNGTASVENSSVSGQIAGRTMIGGIVGVSSSGSCVISNCHTEGIVTSTSYYAGGITGKNIGVITNSYSSSAISGDRYVAGIAGFNEGGTILYSYSTGTVSGSGSIGGISGYSWQGHIEFTFSSGDISSSGLRNGGISGDAEGGIIANSYALGNVTAPTTFSGQNVGGVLGTTYSTISVSSAYAVGNVTGYPDRTAGIVGVVQPDGVIEDSYWNTETTTQSNAVAYNVGTVSNLFGLTTTNMQGSNASTNMNLLDYTSVWETVESTHTDATGNGYPILQGISRSVQIQEQGLLATFALSLNASPALGGSVSGDGAYSPGEIVPIEAVASEGYNFANWTDEGGIEVSNLETFDYTMPAADVTLTANFEAIDYNLSLVVIPAEGGTVTGDGIYNIANVVSLSAAANEGYQFVNWTDEEGIEVSILETFDYTMPAADVELTANFEAIDYNLTLYVIPAAGGSVTGNGVYNVDDVVGLSTTANEGYQFVNWTDEGGIEVSILEIFEYTMPAADVTLIANFELIDYNLTATIQPAGAGTITGEGTYTMGDEVILTATVNPGYEFLYWMDAGINILSENIEYGFAMPAEDINLSANFGLEGKYALEFDGVNDYVSIQHHESLNVGNTVSVEAWIYPTDLSSRYTVFSTRNENATGSWQLEVGTGNNDNNVIAVSGVGTWVAVSEDNVITENKWYHIAFVRGAEGDKLFVNGNEVILQQQTPYSFTDNTSIKTIGVGTNGVAHFPGKIDEVRIWNVALNEADIQLNMLTNLIGNEPGLVSYYMFDEGIGNYAFDNSQNSNTATLTGPPVWVPEELPDLFALNVDVMPEGSAQINLHPVTFHYQGDEGIISLTPTHGFEFVEWTGNTEHITVGDVNTNEITVTIPDYDITLTANLAELDQYELTLLANPVEGGEVFGAGSQYIGLDALVSANASWNYNFINWTDEEDNIISTEAEFYYQMPDKDVTLTANFAEKIPFALPFAEDFTGVTEGSIPADWRRTHGNWAVNNLNVAGGLAPELRFRWNPSATDDFRIHTPVIDASGVENDLGLFFKHHINHWGGPYTLKIQLTTNGTDWTTIWERVNPTNISEHITVQLNDYINSEPMFMLAFVLNGNSYNINYWDIDDIVINSYNTLSLNAAPIEGGSTNGDGYFVAGSQVTAAAIPDMGYEFINWTDDVGDIVSVNSNYTFNMPSEDKTLTANFGLSDYMLVVDINPAGSGDVSLNPDQEFYNFMEEIELTATPYTGYIFREWTGDTSHITSGDIASPVITVTMPDDDVYLIANYEPVYTLEVLILPEASGTVDVNPLQDYYFPGDSIVITAGPEIGFVFQNWRKDGIAINNSFEFIYTMPAEDVVLNAHFIDEAAVLYDLVLGTNSIEGGEAFGEGVFEESEYVNISANSNIGYTFISWTDGLGFVSDMPNYSFNMPGGNYTLTANFELTDYNVNVAIEPVAAGAISGGGVYNMGDEVALNATSDIGYLFVNWTDSESTVVSEDANYTFIMPATDVELTANFEAIDYNLTLLVDLIEGGSVSGDGVYNVGNIISLSATANEGYQFVKWTDESETEVSNQANFDYTMPATDVTLMANFELIDYNVTLAVEPAGTGTISSEGTYNMGDEVVVSATANEGYQFVNWTDSESTLVSEEANYTFTMPAADVELTANFEAIDYNLTLLVAPAEGGSAAGDGVYIVGNIVSLSAIANEGYLFVSWTDSESTVVSVDAEYTFTMPAADVSLTANFERIDYNLSLVASPAVGGSVVGDGIYNFDDVVSLSATANEGYQFVSWTDEGGTEVSNMETFDFTMPAKDATLTANFELIDFNVNVAVEPAETGTISGEGTYNMGDEVVLNAAVNQGYLFVSWTDSESIVVSEEANYTFTMPAADVELTANFEAIDYNLTLIVDPAEGGSVVGDGIYNVDDVVSLSATANEGYQFVSWTDEGGTEVSNMETFDFTMPATDATLTANFELIDFNVNVAVEPASAGTISGDGVYNMGDEVVLSATANEGYLFVSWTDSESTVMTEDADYTFTMPAADVELTANFEAIDYNLTLLVDPVEGGIATGDGIYNVGDLVSLSATANEDYEFVKWSDENDMEISNLEAFDYTMPAADITLTAIFEQETSVPETARATIIVYPNPATTNLNIASDSFISEVLLLNITGKVVLKETVNTKEHTISLFGLSSGTYVIKVFTEAGYFSKKIQIAD